ncbi:MAG TPA: twin-arginine translocase subunit TatC [Cyclobacteriaceae bacterium]|nr:twin-arginine translocase subunit TatC [Cyclobacteriaceae bacterium]
MSGEKEMTFLDHLEELRWHIIRAVLAIVVLMIFAFTYIEEIFDYIILAPAKIDFIFFKWMCSLGELTGAKEALCVVEALPFNIQSRNMTGQFMMSITASFMVGLVVSFPYVVWELWSFVRPGLETKERKFSRGAVFAISSLFLLGVSFGYFILSPMTIWFLSTYQVSSMIVNEFDITSYVSTVASLVLGCGLLFQFPVVVYFLTKIGLVTPALMRQYRRHAIVVIIILGAVVTPSADPFSLAIISLPLYFLYEISIFTSAVVLRKKRKREQQENQA